MILSIKDNQFRFLYSNISKFKKNKTSVLIVIYFVTFKVSNNKLNCFIITILLFLHSQILN